LSIDLVEDYRNWSPPIPARKTVARLMRGVPTDYKVGLKAIVLTNSGARHRRDEQVHMLHVLGRYHPSHPGSAAWIELFVDRIVATVEPSWLARLIPMADLMFARPVFHEIGHHVDMRDGSYSRDLERAANEIEARITRRYFVRRYWFFVPLAILVIGIRRLLRRRMKV